MSSKNNTVLITVVATLTACILVMIIVFLLIFKGVISVGTSQTLHDEQQLSMEQGDPEEKSSKNDATPTTMYVANVANSIYLRSEPVEDESNIITTIPVGAQVVWIENTDTVFSEVSYGGTTGYVKRDYLSATAPQANTDTTGNTHVYKYMYVANVENSIYLRSSAVENPNNIITTIPVGTQIGYIESTNNVFSKINYKGTIGYVKTMYLSDIYNSNYTYMTVYNVKTSIYLRSTPREDSNNIICEIPVGSAVRYLGNANGGFYKIYYDGYIGYAKSIYLR